MIASLIRCVLRSAAASSHPELTHPTVPPSGRAAQYGAQPSGRGAAGDVDSLEGPCRVALAVAGLADALAGRAMNSWYELPV